MTLAALDNGVRMALANIRERKMRSFLTVLGVIIGTGAVIGVGAIIAGLDGTVTNLMALMGPQSVIVSKTPAMGMRTRQERARKPLTLEDARAIQERCPAVQYVSPYLLPREGIYSARYKGNDVYGIRMAGSEEAYADMGVTFLYGRFFTDQENQHHLPLAAIGEDVYRQLMPNEDPIGKRILADGHEFQIVGVMARPAASLPGMADMRVMVSYNAMHKMFPNMKEHVLMAQAYPGMVAKAEDEIRAVLRLRRRDKYDDPDSFYLTTSEQMIEQFHNVTSTVAVVMVVLSSIGLLVGGIGVMNIMLVSVTERTREIGIRKAVGARSSDIVVQFLTEAVVLTSMGGAIGLLLGWMISRITSLVFPNLPTAVPLWAAVLGVLVSVGVGLFFGIWPASRAARLDPVEALRYE
jgi:putative ABC transport system permease protein